MHYRLFLILILGWLPTLCMAQPWSAEVKTGAWWNSKTTQPATHEHSSPLGALLSVGGYRTKGMWEAGLSCGIYPFATRIVGSFIGQDPKRGFYTFDVDYKKRNYALGIKAQLRRYLDTAGRFQTYVGVAPAYYLFLGGFTTSYDIRFPNGDVASDGYGVELHSGAVYRLSETVCLLAEPALGFMNVPVYGGRGYVLNASLSVGVKIRVRQ